MSKKNKHKKTQHDLKIIAARHKNEYLGWIKYYMDLWLGEGTFQLIPERNLQIMHMCRFTTPRLILAPETKIKSNILDDMKDTMIYLMDLDTMEIKKNDKPISFLHFTTYYMTILNYCALLNDDDFARAGVIRERAKEMLLYHDQILVNANEHIGSIMSGLAILFSSPEVKYYYTKSENHLGIKDLTGNFLIFRLHECKPVVEEFIVNDDPRPAFKIGFPRPNLGLDWFKIRPPDKDNFKWKKAYEIYIQSHALDRLYERLNCLKDYHVTFEFFLGLLNPKIIYENGRMLIAYYYGKCKLGYFVTDLVDGKLLMRTFLFVTNEGTPESRKLKEIAGLGKLDISYWNIDKLKNFIDSDIATQPEIKNIFIEAGCGDLFEVNLQEGESYSGRIQLAGEMLRYLKKDNDMNAADDNPVEIETLLPKESSQL